MKKSSQRGHRTLLLVNMRVVFLFLTFNVISLISASVVTLILARGGSKGVRLKNLRTIDGVSLIRRSIHTAKIAGLEDVTVSTDNPLIALEALKSGAKLFHRSSVTASDIAPSIWGAAEFISFRRNASVLVLIQATSPLLRPEVLIEAVKKINYPIAKDCVFSVTRSYKLRWFISNGIASPVNFNITQRPRRQDWNGELIESGAFYITRRHLLEKGQFQNNNCTVVEVSPIESLEVDTHQDLIVAEALLTSNFDGNNIIFT